MFAFPAPGVSRHNVGESLLCLKWRAPPERCLLALKIPLRANATKRLLGGRFRTHVGNLRGGPGVREHPGPDGNPYP